MSKKKRASDPEVKVPIVKKESLIPFSDFRTQAIALAIIAFVFYANSLFNHYALDDDIVIAKNEYVQQGFSGIPKILSTDAYDSFYRSMGSKGELSGGRYRPLSIVTFAIEQAIFGDVPFIRHLVSILLFVLSVVVMLYFLRTYLFKSNPAVAFIATLIFAIHPIHTEVIANVKSRDEIMSLLFIMLTYIYAFQYQDDKKTPTLLKGMLCYFLALLSKEWGITLVALIPVAFYIFRKYDVGKSIRVALPFFLVAAVYMMLRIKIVGLKIIPSPEILNNPYLYAEGHQALATKIFVLIKYIQLLIVPYPLSADYSYNTIPYRNIADIGVALSFVVHLALAWLAWVYTKRRHVLGFAILFYFAYLSMVSNLFFDVGATMGERLIYHSSLGFCIAAAYFIDKGIERAGSTLSSRRSILYGFFAVVGALFFMKCIERNAAWDNDYTLFTHDVKNVPESVLANGNAGGHLIATSEKPENKAKEQQMIKEGIVYLDKSLQIHPKFVNGWLNLGLGYYKLQELEKADSCWKMARLYFPSNPLLKQMFPLLAQSYMNRGIMLGGKQQYPEAIMSMQKAASIDSTNADIWYNMGGAYYSIKQYNDAYRAWSKALQINPEHKDAKRGLGSLKVQ